MLGIKCNVLLVLCLASIASGALQRLFLVFRHGDRTTDHQTFPSDPNKGNTFVNGSGDITDLGRMQGFDLGKRLQDMYKSFITNDTKKVLAQSSPKARCYITTGCVLTGLYTPNNNATCMKGSNNSEGWPAQIQAPPMDKAYLLSDYASCPRLDKEKDDMKNSSKAQEYFMRNKDAIQNLANVTGYSSITEYKTVFDIYDNLVVEKVHNLNMSSWVEPMWPTIQNLLYQELPLEFQTMASLRLTSGTLMNELIQRIQIQNDTANIYLYGTHDTIMEALMQLFDVFNGLPVPYTGTIAVELHDNATVRFMYINSTNAPITLAIPACQKSEYCPVDTLVNITKPLVVTDPVKECRNAAASPAVTCGLLIVTLQIYS